MELYGRGRECSQRYQEVRDEGRARRPSIHDIQVRTSSPTCHRHPAHPTQPSCNLRNVRSDIYVDTLERLDDGSTQVARTERVSFGSKQWIFFVFANCDVDCAVVRLCFAPSASSF